MLPFIEPIRLTVEIALAGFRIQRLLVCVRQRVQLRGQLQSQHLQFAWFRSMHDHTFGRFINTSSQLFFDDQFAKIFTENKKMHEMRKKGKKKNNGKTEEKCSPNQRMDHVHIHVEHGRQFSQRNRFINVRIRQHVRPQRFLLNAPNQHRLHLFASIKQIPNLHLNC